MDIGTAIATVGAAAETAKKLFDLSKSSKNSELAMKVADLMNELASAKTQLAELKISIIELQEENQRLRQTNAECKPSVKWGCYVFEGDSNLYCPACYDTRGRKHLTTRATNHHRTCTVCRTVLGSG